MRFPLPPRLRFGDIPDDNRLQWTIYYLTASTSRRTHPALGCGCVDRVIVGPGILRTAKSRDVRDARGNRSGNETQDHPERCLISHRSWVSLRQDQASHDELRAAPEPWVAPAFADSSWPPRSLMPGSPGPGTVDDGLSW
jgi:hypothetical protein